MKQWTLLAMLAAACSSDPQPTPNQGADQGTDLRNEQPAMDAGPDTRLPDQSAAIDGSPPGPLDVGDYCETTVDMFCDYYLRCGRIDAVDAEDCRSKFLETCNAVFEPQYVALADRGQLELSSEGVAACAEHLRDVECGRHIFDLDGPCRGVWDGQAAAGEPCAPGVGIFVCGAGTECVLDLSLCGVCEPAGEAGEPCVEGRCDRESRCIADQCVARGLTGDDCDDERLCATGLSCSNDVCGAFVVAPPGGDCTAARCPYQSTCLSDVCVSDARIGESCADGEVCGSGFCDGASCVAFREDGAACGANSQCLSGRCEDATCSTTISMCFAP